MNVQVRAIKCLGEDPANRERLVGAGAGAGAGAGVSGQSRWWGWAGDVPPVPLAG
jgi:hypothetical protein